MMMNILKLGWRNIWRNKRRTLLTIIAIAFGVMSIVFAKAYFQGIMKSGIEAVIKTDIGHIRIADKEYLRLERILPKEHMVTDTDSLRKTIEGAGGVEMVMERLKFNVLLNIDDTNEPALATGVKPDDVNRSLDLEKTLVEGTFYKESTLELIIGKGLAKKLNAKLDDELLLVTTDVNYSTYALPFKIVGIFETGFSHMDKHQIYIPLTKAQELLDCRNAAQEVLVYLDNPEQATPMSAAIESALAAQRPDHTLEIASWEENDFIKGTLPFTKQIYDRIYFLILLIVALVILNTMLMTVMERYHEIGVIKALGMKNREISNMILVESFYIGTIGSLIGGAIGGALAALTEKTGIDIVAMMGEKVWDSMDIPIPFIGKVLYPEFSIQILVSGILFGIVISLVAVIYPARKSAKMKPVEAFRSQLKV